MDMELRGKRLTLTNIYGPSEGDNPEFVEKVFNLVNRIGNDTVIIGGDWNCLLNPNLDARNYANPNLRPRTRAKISNSMSDLDLVDIFRKLYPDKKHTHGENLRRQSKVDLTIFLSPKTFKGKLHTLLLTLDIRQTIHLSQSQLGKKNLEDILNEG